MPHTCRSQYPSGLAQLGTLKATTGWVRPFKISAPTSWSVVVPSTAMATRWGREIRAKRPVYPFRALTDSPQ
jgi:hypothetical protein